MTSLESLIGNYREGVFHPTSLPIISYDDFKESSKTDENVLHYGDELVDAKYATVDAVYTYAIDNYIVVEILLSGKDAIPVLDQVKKRKRDANNPSTGDAN